MQLMELRVQLVASQTALSLAREQLIERLGDHMCGGPGGRLTRAELKVLARARRNAAFAQGELAQFLTLSTLTTLMQSVKARNLPAPPPKNDPRS